MYKWNETRLQIVIANIAYKIVIDLIKKESCHRVEHALLVCSLKFKEKHAHGGGQMFQIFLRIAGMIENILSIT